MRIINEKYLCDCLEDRKYITTPLVILYFYIISILKQVYLWLIIQFSVENKFPIMLSTSAFIDVSFNMQRTHTFATTIFCFEYKPIIFPFVTCTHLFVIDLHFYSIAKKESYITCLSSLICLVLFSKIIFDL